MLSRWATLLLRWFLASVASDKGWIRSPPFRIVEIDSGFEAPDTLAAGLRHIVFENRRSQIREDMLVKLDKGTNADY